MHLSPCRALVASVLLALGLAAWGGHAAAAQGTAPAPTIRFAPEQGYPPFVFDGEDGQPVGLSVDILRAIEPDLGVPVTWLPSQPLDAILKAARRGEVDLISSLRPTPERAAYLGFTAAYVNVPAVLLWRRGGPGPSVEAHGGLRVAVGQGYAVEAPMRTRFPRVIWVPVSDDAQGLALLMRGEVTGLVADIGSLIHLLRRDRAAADAAELVLGQAVGFEYPLAFAWHRDRPEWGRRLDQALRDLDPVRRREIVHRWLDPEVLEFRDPKRWNWQRAGLWGLAAVLLAVLVVKLGLKRGLNPKRRTG